MNNTLAKEGFTGSYLHKETGELFALKIVPVIDEEWGHTHVLKNESHTRTCTAKEFSDQFEKM